MGSVNARSISFSQTASRTKLFVGSDEGRKECEHRAWSSGCSRHTDSEKSVWWLRWSTTPPAKYTALTQQQCVWVCVCVHIRTKCCAVRMTVTASAYVGLTLEPGGNKQLVITFGSITSRWEKGGCALSLPPTTHPPGGGAWEALGEGEAPTSRKNMLFEIRSLCVIWWCTEIRRLPWTSGQTPHITVWVGWACIRALKVKRKIFNIF